MRRGMPAKEREQIVYFLWSPMLHLIKIGMFSGTPAAAAGRSRSVVGDPEISIIGAASGDLAQEQILHRKLSEWRVAGEWFQPSDEVASEIWEYMHARGWASGPSASSSGRYLTDDESSTRRHAFYAKWRHIADRRMGKPWRRYTHYRVNGAWHSEPPEVPERDKARIRYWRSKGVLVPPPLKPWAAKWR